MTAINCRLEFERLALLSEEERDRIIRLMTVGDMLAGDVQFESWAHRNQLPPDGQGWNWAVRLKFSARVARISSIRFIRSTWR